MKISRLAEELYKKGPQGTLYHYTSLSGAMGIIEQGSLRTTEAQFFSDAAEITHTVNLLRAGIRRSQVPLLPTLEGELLRRLSERLIGGHLRFIASFTANGNLLSQWRSYCPPAKGVSLGFDAAKIIALAKRQSYQIGKCVYDAKIQNRIATTILKQIQQLSKISVSSKDLEKDYDGSRYTHVFEEVADDILRIAAILKHPSFHEEEEWRIISPVIPSNRKAPIEYREGPSSLVPYMNFQLPETPDGHLDIEHVILGPTPDMRNSMNSLSNYLLRKAASPRRGLDYCRIPYRA